MRRALPFVVLALSAWLAFPAQAKEGDTFRPFVSYTRYYDSNLFRLDDSGVTAVVENGTPVLVTQESASDQYGVLSAGLAVDWKPGRQYIQATASKNRVRFSRYTSLDYDGADYQFKWNWRLGNHWSGQIGATEAVTQTSFTDWYATQVLNNQVTRETRFANADWRFHPRWTVGLGAGAVKSTNSTVQQAPLDYEDTSLSATVGYATPKGSKLRGQLRQVEGENPNRPVSSSVDRYYTQTEYNLLGDWSVSGKLVARAKVGYVQRENDTLSQRDFSGLAGRLSADYSPTGKTVVNWAIYREIANSDDINATYRLSTGTSVGAAWLATSKITMRATTRLENRNFDGEAGGGIQRDEDILSGSLSLSYVPVRMVTVDIGLQAGRRDSNVPVGDYTFHSVFMSVRTDF